MKQEPLKGKLWEVSQGLLWIAESRFLVLFDMCKLNF